MRRKIKYCAIHNAIVPIAIRGCLQAKNGQTFLGHAGGQRALCEPVDVHGHLILWAFCM